MTPQDWSKCPTLLLNMVQSLAKKLRYWYRPFTTRGGGCNINLMRSYNVYGHSLKKMRFKMRIMILLHFIPSHYFFLFIATAQRNPNVLHVYLKTHPANVHSSRSARVLVRRATGRLVLSLVMAKSCMPSSSATLAWVRLLTSELRRSWGHKQTERHTSGSSCQRRPHKEADTAQRQWQDEQRWRRRCAQPWMWTIQPPQSIHPRRNALSPKILMLSYNSHIPLASCWKDHTQLW